jgi:hypothetical protein
MTHQSEDWEVFYEKAWGKRKLLAEQFVKLGITDPFQLIQKMNVFEEKYTLDIAEKSSEAKYIEKEFPGEEHFFPTGKPYYRYVHLGEQLFAQPYYNSVPDFLLDYLDGREFDAIIELGGGSGENLI